MLCLKAKKQSATEWFSVLCGVQNLLVVAVNHVLARAVPVVHSVAQTHFERLAILADARACPFAVAERLKTIVPNLIDGCGPATLVTSASSASMPTKTATPLNTARTMCR